MQSKKIKGTIKNIFFTPFLPLSYWGRLQNIIDIFYQ